jgi:hypothetical protein
MLTTNLNEINTQYPHAGISTYGSSFGRSSRTQSVGAESSTGDGRRLDGPQPRPDHLQIARDLFKTLQLEDSLASFIAAKRISHGDSYLKPRVELNLALERYDEALSLALKARLPPEIFFSAIAAGEYELAAGQLSYISAHLQDQGLHLASVYERLHLLMYVSFATGTSADTASLLARVRNASNFDLTALIGLSELFVKRNFAEFLSQWRQWSKEVDTSMYASASKDKLRTAIENNIVANIARPYSKISFASIASLSKLSVDDVETRLKVGIRAGKILGKLDMIAKNYVGDPAAIVDRDLVLKFERIVAIREKYETLLWAKPYGQQLKAAKAHPR